MTIGFQAIGGLENQSKNFKENLTHFDVILTHYFSKNDPFFLDYQLQISAQFLLSSLLNFD